jgi:hypothetical protein
VETGRSWRACVCGQASGYIYHSFLIGYSKLQNSFALSQKISDILFFVTQLSTFLVVVGGIFNKRCALAL